MLFQRHPKNKTAMHHAISALKKDFLATAVDDFSPIFKGVFFLTPSVQNKKRLSGSELPLSKEIFESYNSPHVYYFLFTVSRFWSFQLLFLT